jgi:hypothetical protein
MKKRSRALLFLEHLETRLVPAKVQFFSGNLFVTAQAGQPVTLYQTANNTFQVVAGSTSTYSGVSNIQITGTNGADSITVNLGTSSYSGSLLINSGNGNDTIDIFGTGGAQLRGSTTLLHSFGDESVMVNADTTSAGAASFLGPITAFSTAGHDSIFFGNTTGVSQFLDTVNTTGLPDVFFGPVSGAGASQPDVFGGDFNMSMGTNNAFGGSLRAVQGEGTGPTSNVITVKGNLTFTGGVGDDGIRLGALTINKNLIANLGGSTNVLGNALNVSDPLSGTTTVDGNLNYTGGSGLNNLDLGNVIIQGSASLNLGDGDANVALDNFNPALPTIIGGNLVINHGNGMLNLAPFNPIQATIGGDVDINQGNGDSTVMFDNMSSVGGTIHYRAGNGNNLLELDGAQLYVLDAFWGNGNDTLTLNALGLGTSVTGRAIGGTGVNTLNQNGATFISPWTQVNF